jgi:hypothetical protein
LADEARDLPGFVLVADGRPIPLTPAAATPANLGLAQHPLPAPASTARVLVSATTVEVIEHLAYASELSVVVRRDGLSARYQLWDDGRSSISAFLAEF